MKKFYFTPGPSQLYFTTESHLKNAIKEDVPSISHRSKAYEAIHQYAVDNVKALLNIPTDYHVLFTGSATEIWERIIQNLVINETHHFVNGAFSKRFYEIALNYNMNAMATEVPEGQSINPEKVLIPETADLIAITQNETSTGASQPVEDIYKLRKAFPNQIISVDVVSSAPYVDLDYNKIDTAYFSVQKCFGLPAGLGVWIINDRCIKKAESKLNLDKVIGSYHSIPAMMEKAVKNQTSETPNVLGIYLLGQVTADMLSKGIKQIRQETDYKAAVLYNAFENASKLRPFVRTEAYRSKTTLVGESIAGSASIISHFAKNGMILGGGYGKFKADHIRVANFPTHSKESIETIADELIKNF